MINHEHIRQILLSRLGEIRANTTIITNSELLDIKGTSEGILAVLATWSGQALVNCTRTIKLLYEQNYNGQIIVIDTDCMAPEFQITTFGQVCHGWGEIFFISNGGITNQFIGKTSFETLLKNLST